MNDQPITWDSLTKSQKITLQAACEIGQVERSNVPLAAASSNRRLQSARTIEALERRGLLQPINKWSSIPTAAGQALVPNANRASTQKALSPALALATLEYRMASRYLAHCQHEYDCAVTAYHKTYDLASPEGQTFKRATSILQTANRDFERKRDVLLAAIDAAYTDDALAKIAAESPPEEATS